MGKCILIVEDEVDILNANKQMLKRRGYDVLTAETVKEALDVLKKSSPDLLVLDMMLPDGSGIEVCKIFRDNNNNPVLFLSAKNDVISKVDGLKCGADYYITKPFHFEELLAIIERLLEKQEKIEEKNYISIGDLQFDYSAFSVKLSGCVIQLTKIEATILNVLLKNINKEVDRNFLYEQVWGAPSHGDSRVLRTHISRLKQKIGCEYSDYYDIVSIYGKGYIFVKN